MSDSVSESDVNVYTRTLLSVSSLLSVLSIRLVGIFRLFISLFISSFNLVYVVNKSVISCPISPNKGSVSYMYWW